MKQTGRWNRALAWLCVVVMIVMMLPMSGFTMGETEEEQPVISETYVPEETVDEAPVETAPAEEQADPEAPAEEAAAEAAELTEEVPVLMLDGADPTEDEVKVVMGANSGLEIDGTGIIKAEDGQSVTIKLDGDHSAHYSLPTLASLATNIRVGDAGYEGVYSYVQSTGVLTFSTGLSAYGGKTITINISAVEDQNHPVEFSLTGIKNITSITKVYVGDAFTCTLEAEDNFTLPTDKTGISITVGTATIASENYTYDPASGQITIPADKLPANTDTLTITATATENPYYTVSLAAESKGIKTIEADTKAYAGKKFTYTLKAEDYYTLPTEVNVAIGGSPAETLAVAENGQISISADKLPTPTTDNTIVITGTATATQYDVTVTTKGKTTAIAKDSTGSKIAETNGNTLSFKATHFSAYTVEFDAGSDKKMPETISVTGAVNYSYSRSNKSEGWWIFESIDYDRLGELKLPISSVCGDVAVSFDKELEGQYNVLVSAGDNSVKSNINIEKDAEKTAKNGTDFNTTLEAENGYTLPAELSVRIKGKDNPLDASLVTWDNTTGALKVAGKVTTDAGTESESTSTVITGSVFIFASATLNNSNYTVKNADETGTDTGIYNWSNQAVVITPEAPATAIQVDGTWYKGIVIGTNTNPTENFDNYYTVDDCNAKTIAFKLGDGTWEEAVYTAAKTSESKSLTFSVDTILPVVEDITNYTNITKDVGFGEKYYTNMNAVVTFQVDDVNFTPSPTAGTQETSQTNFAITCSPTTEYTFAWVQNAQNGNKWECTVTLAADGNNDGEYTVKLDVTDVAGNTNDSQTPTNVSKTIVLDQTSPTFSDDGITYVSKETMNDQGDTWLNQVLWKIFGKKDNQSGYVIATVKVSDTTSPISRAEGTFIVQDANGVQNKAFDISCGEVSFADGKYSATITFTVPAEYKDFITITAHDVSGNGETLEKVMDDEKTANDNGTNLLLDTTAPTISFSPDYATVHNTSYTFDFSVSDESDTSSGLKSVSYKIFKYNSTDKSSSTSDYWNNGNAVSKFTYDADENSDENFVTTISRNATIPLEQGNYNQNSNLVFVEITAVDNAGNTTVERTDCFKMDNTAPYISVVYDNNDALNSKYFKANRTATVTVVDNNFSSDLVEITTGGSILSWSVGSDIGGKDGVTAGDGVVDTYTCQISYTADNDYKLSMTAKDLGGNSTADSAVTYTRTATQDFTLDKTNPIYTVEFRSDNETIENDGYSQGETTVLLSVSEHNFDASSATSGLTVTKDGVDISADIRSALSWASTGDTRTASFVLTEDGDYVVTMSFIDMAGNNSTDAGAFKLHVDQHDPIVKITGVKNKSANNAEKIAPVVTISDKYYNEAGVTITMTNGKGEKVVVYNGSVSKLTGAWLTKSGIGAITRDDDLDTSSQVFTFENIDTDDIYSLVVTMTDLSGRTNSVMTVLNDKNKEEELSLEKNGKMLFSVNRNGSTYTVDDDTMAALNQYVQSIGDVHIMEINVDELDPETIHLTLTHDNNSRDLENGKDYSYQQPPEQNESGWNVYEYILDKSLFEEDGVYTVTVYSVDAAGNISQNNTAEKDFEITFIVDKTAPIFVAMNLEAGEIYNEESRVVTLNCSDNIALDTVHVYLLDSTAEKDADGNYIWYETDAAGNVKWNAEELTVTQDGDNYSFELKEGTSAATSKQSVLVVCTDKAGNQNEEQEILNFTISSSLWIRYYANKPLFYGSIGGIVALLIVAGFIIFRNKDEESKKKSASHLH